MGSRPAAFFRVEGAITRMGATRCAAWFAAQSQEFSSRLARLGAVALSAPASLTDATTGTRMAWMGMRGLSEDRLVVLGEEYGVEVLLPSIRPVAKDLMARARREGQVVVWVSDHLESVVRPVADALKVDVLLANRAEVRNGRCTGALLEPVVGRVGGVLLKDLARQHDLDLQHSAAYGAREADIALLSSVALPCAVHPDRGLRSAARDLDWPVVEA